MAELREDMQACFLSLNLIDVDIIVLIIKACTRTRSIAIEKWVRESIGEATPQLDQSPCI
jgi:hypothetical protein